MVVIITVIAVLFLSGVVHQAYRKGYTRGFNQRHRSEVDMSDIKNKQTK